MSQEIMWLIGVSVTVLLAFGGISATMFWNLGTRIKDGDDKLHERVNEVRKEYVRRDDLTRDFAQIEKSIDELKDNIRSNSVELNNRLDKLFQALVPKS